MNYEHEKIFSNSETTNAINKINFKKALETYGFDGSLIENDFIL